MQIETVAPTLSAAMKLLDDGEKAHAAAAAGATKEGDNDAGGGGKDG